MVFPHPEGPMRIVIEPFLILRFILFTATLFPNVLVTSTNSIIDCTPLLFIFSPLALWGLTNLLLLIEENLFQYLT